MRSCFITVTQLFRLIFPVLKSLVNELFDSINHERVNHHHDKKRNVNQGPEVITYFQVIFPLTFVVHPHREEVRAIVWISEAADVDEAFKRDEYYREVAGQDT
ncbi:hypothetical protein BLA29_012336, partial [Euroglyphus maynei]